MYLTILCGMWSCTKGNGDEVQMGEKVKVRLMYTLDTSTGDDMSRASISNREVFNEFFEKIKSGDLLAPTYNITFTNVENGTTYTFSGNWEDNTFITIRTGKYNVIGYSTAEGASIQNKCSIIFNEPIDITISDNTVLLNGIYDCALIVFNDSNIESLSNFDGENNSSFFSFNTYRYAFVKDYLYLPPHKDKAYILGKYTNGAEFQISTGNLKFAKSKYYVYNSVDNDFNLPPMEDGESVFSQVGDYISELRGLVFFNDGKTVKLVSVEQAQVQWGSGAYDYKINQWDGPTVMNYFKSLDSDLSGYPALKWCNDYGYGWYLPKYDELAEIGKNKYIINSKLSSMGYEILSGAFWSCELAEGWGTSVLDCYDFSINGWGCSKNINTEKVCAVYTYSFNE